ncbi:neutral zinc metallopeptidase [Nonomuraea sp. NPDC049714]|uniref:neutral zinc metallopeptidase n=1 Tax=unclassified Nonomuraea TaxID=2593643 RepID=UPI0037B790A2
MKKLSSLLAAGVVLALAGAGTAVAEAAPAKAEQQIIQQAQQQVAPPRGKAAATANPLYRTGRLAGSRCSTGSLPRGSTAAYKRFLSRVTDCLNRSWASQFRKAGLSFSKPRLRIITKKVRTPCGNWSSGADGIYCSANRTMYMLITKQNLRNPFALGITRLMAHEYGHHVQQVSGIWNYYWTARSRASRSSQLLLSRRSELQAECFSAVFMNSVRNTLPVTSEEWNHTVNWFHENGHKGWAQNDHGKGPTQAYWMTRGFNSGSVGSCNTWSASSRRVA